MTLHHSAGNVHGEEELNHEPEEANKDVGVESVLGDDLLRVGAKDGGNPGKQSMGKRVDLLAVGGKQIVSWSVPVTSLDLEQGTALHRTAMVQIPPPPWA